MHLLLKSNCMLEYNILKKHITELSGYTDLVFEIQEIETIEKYDAIISVYKNVIIWSPLFKDTYNIFIISHLIEMAKNSTIYQLQSPNILVIRNIQFLNSDTLKKIWFFMKEIYLENYNIRIILETNRTCNYGIPIESSCQTIYYNQEIKSLETNWTKNLKQLIDTILTIDNKNINTHMPYCLEFIQNVMTANISIADVCKAILQHICNLKLSNKRVLCLVSILADIEKKESIASYNDFIYYQTLIIKTIEILIEKY